LHCNSVVAPLTSTTGANKSSNVHQKSSVSNRHSNQQQQQQQHHHHHHHQQQQHHRLNFFSNEKKRRLPCLLQRLIDDGNLIKEAVRRLKSQPFSGSCQQQQQNTMINTPSTPTTKSSFPILSNVNLSTAGMAIPQSLNDSPKANASSPNLGLSWFLTSNVFGANNHANDNNSSIRTRVEIGIHDG
jgi:G3E family GTPase